MIHNFHDFLTLTTLIFARTLQNGDVLSRTYLSQCFFNTLNEKNDRDILTCMFCYGKLLILTFPSWHELSLFSFRRSHPSTSEWRNSRLREISCFKFKTKPGDKLWQSYGLVYADNYCSLLSKELRTVSLFSQTIVAGSVKSSVERESQGFASEFRACRGLPRR